MSFDKCDKEIGKGLFVSLGDDGDAMDVVFVGEPVPRAEMFMGQPRKRAYFPVLTVDGLQVWGAGAKSYKWLRDNWQSVGKKLVKVTRQGKKGSTETVYEFSVRTLTKAWQKALKEVKLKDISDVVARLEGFESPAGDDVPF